MKKNSKLTKRVRKSVSNLAKGVSKAISPPKFKMKRKYTLTKKKKRR